MNKERLLILANFLETVPEQKFDMNTWRYGSRVDGDSDASLLNSECGTSGCAVGWACAIPELQAQGLFWSDHELQPQFGKEYNWLAVEAFFEITFDEAYQLFDSSSYSQGWVSKVIPPGRVAKEIRSFVGIAP